MFIDEGRNIVADIEDEPDRDESGDAVKVNLHEVPNDITIHESHGIFEFRFAIAELQYEFGSGLSCHSERSEESLIHLA
jgi:hypothetical protein